MQPQNIRKNISGPRIEINCFWTVFHFNGIEFVSHSIQCLVPGDSPQEPPLAISHHRIGESTVPIVPGKGFMSFDANNLSPVLRNWSHRDFAHLVPLDFHIDDMTGAYATYCPYCSFFSRIHNCLLSKFFKNPFLI